MFVDEALLSDVYWDSSDYALTMRDHWMRSRNNTWSTPPRRTYLPPSLTLFAHSLTHSLTCNTFLLLTLCIATGS